MHRKLPLVNDFLCCEKKSPLANDLPLAKIVLPFLLLVVVISFFVSCKRQTVVRSLEQENLFALDYGNFEDQINLFDVSEIGNVNTALAMRDGFFYIANGASKKILELNSYGDILTIYYSNEDDGGTTAHTSGREGIKKEIPFPVDFASSLTVDTHKNIYLTATLPRERHEYDDEMNLLNSQIVLKFAENGNSIDYLGQRGLGGTPFPFIRHIATTDSDEVVVVCTTNTGSLVYWFSSTGFLKYRVPIDIATIPRLENATDVTIENIFPDYSKNILYVKADYYAPHIDRDTNTQTGIDYVQTLLYPLYIDSGTYGNPIPIPSYEQSVTEAYSRIVYDMPYDYLGTTRGGWHFFLVATAKGFNVQMVQPDSQRILRRQFEIPRNDIMYYVFSLSDAGIISGLFASKEGASIVWWRTDTLIESILRS